MSRRILYVNTEWGNLASLDAYGDEVADALFHVTWRELLFDILGEDSSEENLEALLEYDYGLEISQLDHNIPEEIVEKHYSSIAFRYENEQSAEVDAFNLIRDLSLFEMDQNGNGSAHGVELCQSKANGPSKSVYIEDEKAGRWLEKQFQKKSLEIEVRFV